MAAAPLSPPASRRGKPGAADGGNELGRAVSVATSWLTLHCFPARSLLNDAYCILPRRRGVGGRVSRLTVSPSSRLFPVYSGLTVRQQRIGPVLSF